ncbi:MAG TPA: methyltransferase domain-containing protein [Gammaproteobacteria bacterium]|nr:methyltransferase domain-containing protein [Gammaproteobacteria bacterium]
MAILIFVVLYIATFKLAWKMLAQLVAVSAHGHSVKSFRFWYLFVGYRVVIAAPYLAFLALGQNVPTSIRKLVFWWIVLGIVLGMLRFVGAERVSRFLWWSYGHVYDGLLKFWPYHNLLKEVVDRLELKPGMKLLEAGCGTGNVIKLAVRRGALVDGVDDSSSMIRTARKKLASELTLRKARLYKQDLLTFLQETPRAEYDRISLVNVLYAVGDRKEIWRQCLRVLKPGGKIVVTTSDKGGSLVLIKEHLDHASCWKLFSPRLLAVVIIDFFISELAKAGPFEFPSKENLVREVKGASAQVCDMGRIYGGDENGVNVIFTVVPQGVGN